jgi:hypothetical protein
MKYMKLFEQFLLERDIVMDLLKDTREFFERILKDAKTNKLVKYVTSTYNWYNRWNNPPKWAPDNLIGHREDQDVEYKGLVSNSNGSCVKLLNGKLVEFYAMLPQLSYQSKRENGTETLEDSFYNVKNVDLCLMLVISEEPLVKSEIDAIMPDNVKGTYKNDIWDFKLKLVDDFSNKLTKFNRVKRYATIQPKSTVGSFDAYALVYKYEVTQSKGTDVSFDEAKKLPEMTALLDKYPIEIVSNAKQIKNGTILFGIPKKYLMGPADKVKNYVTDKKEFDGPGNIDYLYNGYAIFKSGYVRSMPMWNKHWSDRASVVGTFDATSIEGWKKAITSIDKSFETLTKNIEKNDMKLISTAEDRAKYKGYIIGHDYGI